VSLSPNRLFRSSRTYSVSISAGSCGVSIRLIASRRLRGRCALTDLVIVAIGVKNAGSSRQGKHIEIRPQVNV
jgi:hypothetical protein